MIYTGGVVEGLDRLQNGEMKCLTEKEQPELGATRRGLWREQGRTAELPFKGCLAQAKALIYY